MAEAVKRHVLSALVQNVPGVGPTTAKVLAAAGLGSLESLRSAPDSDLLAVPGLRKDGTRNSIEFTIVLLKDKDGKVEAMASVIRDVTKNFMAMKELKKQLADSSAGKT